MTIMTIENVSFLNNTKIICLVCLMCSLINVIKWYPNRLNDVENVGRRLAEFHIIRSSEKKHPNCALLFFGAPRLFKDVVLPSIQKYVLNPNSECDIFLHTYNSTSITTARNNEVNGKVSPMDVYELTPNVVMDTMEEFQSQRNLTFYRQFHPGVWGRCCDSIDNLVKQWHSIDAVWNLMETYAMDNYGKNASETYGRIGLFRSDVFYTHPIAISNSTEEAVIPIWAYMGRRVQGQANDRVFYGNYDNAKVWATKRFDHLPDYIAANGRLHSESFMFHLLQSKNKVNLEMKQICFWRTRTTGLLMSNDCLPPTPTGELEDPLDFNLLNNSRCCWNCPMPWRPEAERPCTVEEQTIALTRRQREIHWA